MDGTNMGNVGVQTPTTPVSNLHDVRIPEGSFAIGFFDGKQRYIRFDLNAFAELEERYGTIEKAQEVLSSGSLKAVRMILWIGLIWDEVELDPFTGDVIKYTLFQRDVGRWITPHNMNEVMKTLQIAITGALPEPEDIAAIVPMLDPKDELSVEEVDETATEEIHYETPVPAVTPVADVIPMPVADPN